MVFFCPTKAQHALTCTGVLVLRMTLTRSEHMTLTARYLVEAASGYTSQTTDVRLRYQF